MSEAAFLHTVTAELDRRIAELEEQVEELRKQVKELYPVYAMQIDRPNKDPRFF